MNSLRLTPPTGTHALPPPLVQFEYYVEPAVVEHFPLSGPMPNLAEAPAVPRAPKPMLVHKRRRSQTLEAGSHFLNKSLNSTVLESPRGISPRAAAMGASLHSTGSGFSLHLRHVAQQARERLFRM